MTSRISSYSHFWNKDPGDYVLWRRHHEDLGEVYLIFNVKYRSVAIIEDNELAREIINRMKEAGVPIVDELPPGINPVHEMVQELFAAGASTQEINRKIREMEETELKERKE
ncbi:MAG TPA: hypothetical protein VG099_11420, partial [Gemmataceae bacterium]|nr:hypothetical protein [Gemmataceae bacterium]